MTYALVVHIGIIALLIACAMKAFNHAMLNQTFDYTKRVMYMNTLQSMLMTWH